MAKFKVSDKARIVYIRNKGPNPNWKAGIIVEVVYVHTGNRTIRGK